MVDARDGSSDTIRASASPARRTVAVSGAISGWPGGAIAHPYHPGAPPRPLRGILAAVTATAERAKPRDGRPRAKARARAETPVLVRQLRNGIEESVHRGDIVEADVSGRLIRQLGDPDRLVTLRSTVKPFGVVALIEAGGIEAFDLEPAELAIMASSHSGEDFHVRTIQGVFRRAGRQPGAAGLRQRGDAARRADRRPPRAGRREGRARSATCARASTRSRCSCPGSRAGISRPTGEPQHPAQVAYRSAVGAGLRHDPGAAPDRDRRLRRGDLRVPAATRSPRPTPCWPIRRAVPAKDPRRSLAPALTLGSGRDAGEPGDDRRPPRPPRHLADEGRRGPRSSARPGWRPCAAIAILPGPRGRARAGRPRPGMAVKIEDGDGYDRGTWAASVEALRQAGVLDGQALRVARSLSPADDPRSARPGRRRSRSPNSSSRRWGSSSAEPAGAPARASRPSRSSQQIRRWPPTPIRTERSA